MSIYVNKINEILDKNINRINSVSYGNVNAINNALFVPAAAPTGSVASKPEQVQFDGSTYFDLSNLNLTFPFTICLMLNITQVVDPKQVYFATGPYECNLSLSNDPGIGLWAGQNRSISYNTHHVSYGLNTWLHLIVEFSGNFSRPSFWLDGTLGTDGGDYIYHETENFYYGANYQGSVVNYANDTYAKNLYVYNRSLTSDERQSFNDLL